MITNLCLSVLCWFMWLSGAKSQLSSTLARELHTPHVCFSKDSLVPSKTHRGKFTLIWPPISCFPLGDFLRNAFRTAQQQPQIVKLFTTATRGYNGTFPFLKKGLVAGSTRADSAHQSPRWCVRPLAFWKLLIPTLRVVCL